MLLAGSRWCEVQIQRVHARQVTTLPHCAISPDLPGIDFHI